MSYFSLDSINWNPEKFALEQIEQAKNTEILKVSLKCVDEMLSFVKEKSNNSKKLINSLQKTKEEIEYWLKIGKVTGETVITIVKKIIEYKEELEFLGMFLSSLIHLLPLLHILTMFLVS